jgi:hypothetical protein
MAETLVSEALAAAETDQAVMGYRDYRTPAAAVVGLGTWLEK